MMDRLSSLPSNKKNIQEYHLTVIQIGSRSDPTFCQRQSVCKGYSPRARNRFNQVVEAKRFEGVFLCRKVC